MMTNVGLNALITEFGDRIGAIGLNNGKMIYINYPGIGASIEQIEFKTVDGCDLFGFPALHDMNGKKVHFICWNTTEFIEFVQVMDEEDKDFRVDPIILR